MKNKKTLYLLIPLVSIIWGIIIWQILSYRAKETETSVTFSVEGTTETEDTISYVLVANYRDPFLRNTIVKIDKKESATRNNNIITLKVNNTVAVGPPTLFYSGKISHKNISTGLVRYKGYKYLVKENQNIDDLEIISLGSDSIRIRFNKKIYTYGKK